MLELLVCATFTVLPDYLYRRYAQGKRIGQEIDLFTVWYELRYGLTGCLILTILLITTVFYYHPSTTDVSSFFRTVTILPERNGRVKEVYAENGAMLSAGDRIFVLEDDQQQAAAETAQRRVEEIEAQFALVEDELAAARGAVSQAQFALKEAQDELDDQLQLLASNSPAAREREAERLQNRVDSRQGGVDAAEANYQAVETKKSTLLPAQLASAKAALKQAETDLAQSVVYASTDGELQQFALQPGDVVNPAIRTAGILVPRDVGEDTFQAAFHQISAQVLKQGMVTEVLCMSNPFTIIPMRITAVQDFLPSGQFRPSDVLVDMQDRARPGSVQVKMEPIFEGSADSIPRGSKCIANAYTDNHEALANEDHGFWNGLFLHMVDTVGLVHALILRIQALLMPVQTLVLSGH
jgi:multidrug resistance efflux pump